MSKRLIGRVVAVAAILCGVALVPAIAISLYVGYYMLVPRYSSVAEFEKYGFNLRLDLYLTDDEERDSGRYLNVITSWAYERLVIPGWDWSHRARTNIYRVDQGHFAVLSPFGSDYLVTLKPISFASLAVSDGGQGWQYLGAFDFDYPPGKKRRLQFFDASLPECIPMGLDDQAKWQDMPRPQVRRAACPSQELP